jgi:hypothetical protein
MDSLMTKTSGGPYGSPLSLYSKMKIGQDIAQYKKFSKSFAAALWVSGARCA